MLHVLSLVINISKERSHPLSSASFAMTLNSLEVFFEENLDLVWKGLCRWGVFIIFTVHHNITGKIFTFVKENRLHDNSPNQCFSPALILDCKSQPLTPQTRDTILWDPLTHTHTHTHTDITREHWATWEIFVNWLVGCVNFEHWLSDWTPPKLVSEVSL